MIACARQNFDTVDRVKPPTRILDHSFSCGYISTTKHEVARVLQDIAFFLFLKGDNPFKAQAYERAAMAILTAPADLADLIATDSLTDLSGIGPATARVITELVTTGSSTMHEEAQGEYPLSLVTQGEVPGLSRKQFLKLYDVAGITSVADLKAACREGRLVAVPGIGPNLQAKLLDALRNMNAGGGITYTPG